MNQVTGLWVLGGCLGLLLGCGGITQPLGSAEAGSSGAGGSGGAISNAGGKSSGGPSAGSVGAGDGDDVCITQCAQAVFSGTVASCKLCHANLPAPDGLQSSGLDFQSPGLMWRLKDVAAKHADLTAPASAATDCPTGDKLIDSAAPQNSWLLKKLHGQQGTCGTQMPQPPTTLKAQELACVDQYVYCVAAQ